MAWTEKSRIPMIDGRLLITYANTFNARWGFVNRKPEKAIAGELIWARAEVTASVTAGQRQILLYIEHTSDNRIVYSNSGGANPSKIEVSEEVNFMYGQYADQTVEDGLAGGEPDTRLFGISPGLLLADEDDIWFALLNEQSGDALVPTVAIAFTMGT